MARVPRLRESGGRSVETPENRITIRETLDGLGIYNPARRNILVILFLMLWLAGWAFGEYFALSEIARGRNIFSSLFLLVWLGIWTLGGLGAAAVLLWNLFGSERLFVTGGVLVHSRGYGPLQRRRVHPVGEVSGLTLDTRSDPANGAVQFGTIGYRAGGRARRFGIGMTRAEAEASLAAIHRALPFDGRAPATGD